MVCLVSFLLLFYVPVLQLQNMYTFTTRSTTALSTRRSLAFNSFLLSHSLGIFSSLFTHSRIFSLMAFISYCSFCIYCFHFHFNIHSHSHSLTLIFCFFFSISSFLLPIYRKDPISRAISWHCSTCIALLSVGAPLTL